MESKGEAQFALHCRIYKLTPVQELRFDLTRRWRFDFAFPEKKLAVESEGGSWTNGRHTRGKGYSGDLEKYNAATLQGWRVLRYTPEMVKQGVALHEVIEALK